MRSARDSLHYFLLFGCHDIRFMRFDAAKVILFSEKCKEMAVNFQLRTENQQKFGVCALLGAKKAPKCTDSYPLAHSFPPKGLQIGAKPCTDICEAQRR